MIVSRHLAATGTIVAGSLLGVALLAAAMPTHAADCPSAASGKGSFVLARRAGTTMEVFYDDGPTIRTSLRAGDRKLLETTMYQGLFELTRDDRGTRIEQKPKSDLGKFFPLKPKQTISADFDVIMNGDTRPKTVRLEYVGAQDYTMGDCTYNVLRFHRVEKLPILYDDVDYYAPELRYVVAKEYRDDNGRTTIVGYTKISSGKGEVTR